MLLLVEVAVVAEGDDVGGVLEMAVGLWMELSSNHPMDEATMVVAPRLEVV
jgi:hypothetical protein